MKTESLFVNAALEAAQQILAPPLSIARGEPLLYQVTVNNELRLTVDPAHAIRGSSAFQTDLCVFEQKQSGVKIPRVVLEFKGKITTHDVLTYSAKARKHKQVYPYLRYGVVMSEEKRVPGRVFTHNEALDFALALRDFKTHRLHDVLASTIQDEVEASRRLEEIIFGSGPVYLFRTEPITASGSGKVS
jgi:hypothetical protein